MTAGRGGRRGTGMATKCEEGEEVEAKMMKM